MKFDIIEWCEDNINNVKLNSTKQLVGDCPWCGKSGHFYVDSEEGHYICFACSDINPSVGKYAIGLISHVEGISISEARRFIIKNRVEFRRKETPKTLVDKISRISNKGSVTGMVNYPLPKEFIPVYQKGKWSFPVYLKERGVKKFTAKEWGLGWSRKGRFGGRVIIPVSCPNGNSFTARDVTGKQEPKYLNPSGADHSKLLLGWYKHKIKGDVVIVEGPMDAIRLWQNGFSVIALMGKVLHVEQMIILSSKPRDASITIMLDPEESEAPYNVAEQLVCRFEDVSIAKLPDGIDPGDSTKDQVDKAISEAMPYVGNKLGKVTSIILNSRRKLDEFYS